MSFEDLSRAQLLEMLDDFLEQHDRRRQELTDRAGEQTRLIAELQLYQVELEIQNRELRRAHVELEEARDRFSELFELAPIAYLTLDDAGRITGANHAAITLLQQTADELLGRSLVELSGHSDELASVLARSTQDSLRSSAELKFDIAEDTRDIEVIVAFSADHASRAAYRCALMDVTARRRAERERDQARASEQALHECFQALDRIHVAVNSMLASGDRTRVRDLIRLFADAVLQLFDGQEVVVSLEGVELRALGAVQVAGTTVPLTQRIALAGRTLGTMRVSVLATAPVLRSQSVTDYSKLLELLAGRLAIALEMARLRDVEAEEHRRLHWLDRARHLLTAGGDPEEVLRAVAECCNELRDQLVNDCAAYATSDQGLLELTAPRRFASLLQRWLDREQPRQQQRFDVHNTPRLGLLLKAAGSESLLVLPLHSRKQTLGYLCFALPARGNGELLRTLEEISFMAAGAFDTAQLLHALRGAVDARDTLLALVAHDLRSPLNAISLTASSMSEPPAHPERRRSGAQFKLIQRSVQRMAHLIDDLLTAANIDSGTFAINELALPPNELAYEACALNAPAAENRGIELSAECPDHTPDVCADRERVLQVLTNLIVNALKFSAHGSSVVVRVQRDGQYMRYVVRDHGVGMTSEQCANVFRRYWRVKGSRGGLGLGLFIAERIVTAHRGRIWVESTPGEGATFQFTLPLASPHVRQTSNQEAPHTVHS